MITKRLIIRDAIIVVLILVAGFFLIRSKRPGPADVDTAKSPHGADASAMPSNHGSMPPDISAGEPVASMAGGAIGKDWYDDKVKRTFDMLKSQSEKKDSSQDMGEGMMGGEKFDEESANKLARQEALVEGAVVLIERQSIKEMNIQPDPEVIARQQKEFDASKEAADMMQQMGITRERLETLWKEESAKTVLHDTIAKMAGAEPGTDASDNAYVAWVMKKLQDTKVEFKDPALEPLYNEYLAMIKESVAEQASTVQDENLGGTGEPMSGSAAN